MSLNAGIEGNRLPFEILSSSSADENHSSEELLKFGPHTRGWQSAKNAVYPQEVVLQFSEPVTVQTLEILSHQSKISPKIELFICFPPTTGLKYRRLGYVAFSSNDDSQHRARELKTVHLNQSCTKLKLLLHEGYTNHLNPHKQVGLIAINPIGVPYTVPKPEPVSSIEDQIEALKAAKLRAVEAEDFELAKQLKLQIDKLSAQGPSIEELERLKQEAVDREDFDEAKRLKLEIDRMRKGSVKP
mmetsp:Transcript_9300/g.17806  ORF Transcript_9300/g.17806 Transcript_9300/m.17806 type:complete len:244 (+) Transcript_9300:1316-2047(+)|eukprot:CAMPEP_0204902146 /NCGR_PEP_ID=MMETSP1397-20131031/3491_1 /ASSEMBLY_ACC=CAM_ASM_000891 /TAXON_ID=49980 /ORGANISM="Climacostomum Climacostomum virens, Strain Stock W-24" /LENGTH=243 /DNA_ID=CAMNT_0052070603 /DNA_START=1300 /DNA_END=2031 /DNA_ORIENTATION=-